MAARAQRDRTAPVRRDFNAMSANVRAVALNVHAACPYSIAQEYAVDYLRRAEAREDEAEIRVPLAFLPRIIRRRVAISFGLHYDVAERGRPHDEIRLHWGSGTPLLPDFRGTLRFRIAGAGTDLLVEGSYGIPLGMPGRIFDNVLGRHVARASLHDFACRIAGTLEANDRVWRAKKELNLTRV